MKKQKNTKGPAADPAILEQLPPEQREIVKWLKTVKFKRKLFGGVDEADLWRKLEELNSLYEKALLVAQAGHAGSGMPPAAPDEGGQEP